MDAGLVVQFRDAVAHGEGTGFDDLRELGLRGGQPQGGGGEGVVELGEGVARVLDVLDGALGGGDEGFLGYLGGGLQDFGGRGSLLGLGLGGRGCGGWDGVGSGRKFVSFLFCLFWIETVTYSSMVAAGISTSTLLVALRLGARLGVTSLSRLMGD